VVRLLEPSAVLERLRRDVDRNVLRARHALKHLAGVGRPELGCSPKTLVWERDKVRLYRFDSDRRRLRPPVLLVMSLVGRAQVFDLVPGNSFVEALLERGFDVYSLDWGVPDAADSQNSFETYCDEYLPRAAEAVLDDSGDDELTVYGYCFGGVLSLLFVAGHPELPVRNLAVMATPIDFEPLGATSVLLREGRIDLDDMVDETGNVPARTIQDNMKAMKATGDLAQYASLLQNLESSEYMAAHLALTGWANDQIPFPGACYRQTAEWFHRDGLLQGGVVPLGGRDVDIRSIECPVANIVGDKDHIVPPESTAPLEELLPDADVLRFPSGHVGLIVGGSAHRRTIPAIADWLEAHSEPAS
jgi:polyhydroxyalkanoate synthase